MAGHVLELRGCTPEPLGNYLKGLGVFRLVAEQADPQARAWWKDGVLTRRKVDPYCLYYDPQLEALYVFGWCHTRRAMRTFAVHRFRQATITSGRFEVPAGFTPETYLRGAFRIWRGENALTVRIAVDAEAAGWVTERRWHASQKVRRRPNGGCELTFTLDGVRELQRFVLQLGAAAEVLEPEWFRAQVADEHARAARRNQGRGQERMTLDDTGAGNTRRGS